MAVWVMTTGAAMPRSLAFSPDTNKQWFVTSMSFDRTTQLKHREESKEFAKHHLNVNNLAADRYSFPDHISGPQPVEDERPTLHQSQV